MLSRHTEEAADETAALMARLLDPSVVDQLLRLPDADDQAFLMGRLFYRAMIGAYYSQPGDLPLVVGKNIDQVLRTGLTPHLGITLGFGGMLVLMQGNIDVAMAHGEAALAIAERFDDPFHRARGELAAWLMIVCWNRPFAESEQALRDLAPRCLAAGDFEFRRYSIWGAYVSALVAGRDYSAILELAEEWFDCL